MLFTVRASPSLVAFSVDKVSVFVWVELLDVFFASVGLFVRDICTFYLRVLDYSTDMLVA